MPIKIQISYEKLDDVTPDELDVLKKHEDLLKSNLTKLLGVDYEKFDWLRDKDVSSQRYFEFRAHRDRRLIFQIGVLELAKIDPDDLLTKIAFASHKGKNQ